MFDITRFAIERSRITMTFLALIVILGLMAFFKLPKAEDPGFVVRIARVTTAFPGASPERIENLVTDKLEKAIREIPELDYVASESEPGFSIITVHIQDRYHNMRPIWDTLRRKVERASRELPDGVIGPFVNDEFGDVFGTILTITGNEFSYRELKDIADEMRDELLRIKEVSKVDIFGAQEERVFIEYQDTRLAQMGGSVSLLQQMLDARNILVPGGTVTTPNERIILEPTGNFNSIEDLKNTLLRVPGQDQLIYLKDFSTVTRGYVDPPERLMHSSGERCIALAISLRDNGNIAALGQKAKALIKKMEERYPVGIQFDFALFQAKEVARKVNEFIENLIESLVIVLGTTLLILGFRTGVVVASLIPMTIFMTFAFMGLFGIGIDQISLAALIIALGIFVDNAIVISESILTEYTHERGLLETALASTRELRIPMLTSSLTTAVAFLPIFLANSAAGEYTAALFEIVTLTLLCSWFLSLTMIPMLCVRFLKPKPNLERTTEAPVYRWYRSFLLLLLKHPKTALSGFVGAFSLSMAAFLIIPQNFFPSTDHAMFTAELDLPVGTRIERTEQVVAEIEKFLNSELKGMPGDTKPGVVRSISFIGGFAPRYILNFNPKPIPPEGAFIMIETTTQKAIPQVRERLKAFASEHFPELRVTPRSIDYGPPVDSSVGFRISGNNITQLLAIADGVKNQLIQTPGADNVRDDWQGSAKKLLVNVNQQRALAAGVTSRDVAISLQTRLSGIATTQYREGDQVIPVIMRSIATDREDLDRLEGVTVHPMTTAGPAVPLKQVADLDLVWEPSKIHRRNRVKTITVKAGLQPGFTANQVADAMIPWLEQAQKDWPQGFFYEVGGEVETARISSESIFEQLPIAGLVMALILIVQFDSFIIPIVICSTIAMGVIGVVIGMLVTGTQLGFMALLGVVSLSGIVVNHAIILLDRMVTERVEMGKTPQEAIICAAQRRMRPILLTTITVIGGLLPLWLGGGDLFKPMAVAIIFGLTISTGLTLGFCPVLYAFLNRVSFAGVSSAEGEGFRKTGHKHNPNILAADS